LTGGPGNKIISGQLIDKAGNIFNFSDSIIYDITPPTILSGAITGLFNINSGDTYTRFTGVYLIMNVTGADYMRFANSGELRNETGAFATRTGRTLPAGDGTKYVSGLFIDYAGNRSGYSDYITLDQTAPIFSGNGIAIDSGMTTPLIVITFADPTSGISGNVATISGLDNSYLNTGFVSGSTFTGGGHTTGKFIFTVSDVAGNSTGVTFNVNTNGAGTPTCTPPSSGLTGRYSGSSVSVNCTSSVPSDTLYFTSGTVSTIDTPTYTGAERTTTGTFTGSHFFIKIISCTNANVCSTQKLYEYIQDQTTPTVIDGGFQINTGATYTTGTSVWFTNISGTDSCNQVWVSYGTSSNIIYSSDWTTDFTNKSVILNTGDGTKTGYVRFKDCADNITGSLTDTIILDSTPPTGSFEINSGSAYTNSGIVWITNITGLDNYELSGMRFTTAGSGWGGRTGFSTANGRFDLIGGTGTKVISGQLIDKAGNIFNMSDSISYNNVGPTITSGSSLSGLFEINSGATYTNVTGVYLIMHVTGANQMRFANSGESRNATGTFATRTGRTLLTGDGTKYVSGLFIDQRGNMTGGSDSIILDQTAPIFSGNGIAIVSGETYTGLTITFSDPISGISGNVATISGLDNSYHTGNFISGSTFIGGGVISGTFIFTVSDNAGNSTGIIFKIDRTPPTISIIYSPESGHWTSGNVLATATGLTNIPTINTGFKTFSTNGTFDFEFTDNNGLTGKQTATVTRIDKGIPWISGATNGGYYNTGITISFGDSISSASGKLNGLTRTSSFNTNIENSYVFTATDQAGNTNSVHFIIDKTAPYFTGVTSGTTYTSSVYIYFYDSGSAISGATLNGSGYTSGSIISGNGTYTFIVTDLAGNWTGATFTITPPVVVTPTVNGGSSNGGGDFIKQDNCKRNSKGNNLSGANASGIDYSSSYYDQICYPSQTHGVAKAICDVSKSTFSTEITNAFDRAYGAGITTLCPIEKANVNGLVTRREMAKMISVFATKIMGLKPDTTRKCKYTDTSKESDEMKAYATLACQLKIMGLKYDGTPDTTLRPNGLVTRAQFGTMLSRLIYGNKYNGNKESRYGPHLSALKKNGIIKDISKPTMQEQRGYIMIMLMRTAGGHPELQTNKSTLGSSIGSTFSSN
ncbi:MAG: S-layer homology domain-containing protein, partial [Candidatus Absconditabacterales bacterium]